jgi:sugar (pentulose or hexulose) kinase
VQSREHAARTGLTRMVPERAPVKMHWFARHEPAIWARCRSAMTICEYLTFFLTGERVGDGSTAALTGVFDLQTKAWWPEALEVLGSKRVNCRGPCCPARARAR